MYQARSCEAEGEPVEELLKNAVVNMCWIASHVHGAHHYVDDGFVIDGPLAGDPEPDWRKCKRGICGSMERILAQSGFDKNLNPIPVRP